MGIEASVSTINSLDPSLPADTDLRAQGPAHIREIKNSLQQTFPNLTGPMTGTQEQLNALSAAFSGTTFSPSMGSPEVTTSVLFQDVAVAGQTFRLQYGNGNFYLTNLTSSGGIGKQIIFDGQGGLTAPGDFKAGGGTILCPIGSIMLWSGPRSTIPTGWAVCDGTSNTPNLGGLVPYGATSDSQILANAGSATSSVTVSGTTVTDGAHTHPGASDPQGSHNHTGATGTYALQLGDIPAHSHGVYGQSFSVGSGSGSFYALGTASNSVYQNTASAGSGNAHGHSIGTDGTHQHNITVSSAGDHSHAFSASGSVSTLQPSFGVYFIMRIS